MTAAATTDCIELASESGVALAILHNDDDSGLGCIAWLGAFP